MSFCVKTHDVELLTGERAEGSNLVPGVVRGQAYLGSHRDYMVDIGQEVLIAAPAALEVADGHEGRACASTPERCRGLAQ